MDRTISEVLDMRSGHQISAEQIFSQDEGEIFELRRELRKRLHAYKEGEQEAKWIVCSHCYEPVYIAGTSTGDFFFKHAVETGDCPIKTSGNYTPEQLNAMRYNGAKESKRHFELKHYIAKSLENDPHFSEVKIEERIKRRGLSKEWRQPDVSAKYKDKDIVIEIQLSSAFQDTIIKREEFYHSESRFIFWVFDNFSVHGSLFTEKDIYYTNRRNAFVITDESKEKTMVSGNFYTTCLYQVPIYNQKGVIEQIWKKEDVSFEDLVFSDTDYKIYYYNYFERFEYLKKNKLAIEFEEFWLSHCQEEHEIEGAADKRRIWWMRFKREKLIPGNDDLTIPYRLQRIFCALYSVKNKRMVGYNYKKWIQLANLIAQYYPEYFEVFVKALRQYNLMDQVIAEDKKMKFRYTAKLIRAEIDKKNSDYIQNKKFNRLFSRLFPEIVGLN